MLRKSIYILLGGISFLSLYADEPSLDFSIDKSSLALSANTPTLNHYADEASDNTGEIAGIFGTKPMNNNKNDEKSRSGKKKKKGEEKRTNREFCRTNNGGGITGEFLYWSTNFNFPFALVGAAQDFNLPFDPAVFGKNTLSIKHDVVGRVKQKWSPGFRVAAAYYPDYDNIDLKAKWTYFYNHPEAMIIGAANLIISSFNSAKASLKFIYNASDVELGKSYSLASRVLIRPFCGVRAAWLKQNLHFHFKGTTTATAGAVTLTGETPITILLDQRIWGVGPRIGLDTSWFKWAGLSVMGNISAALLYGKGTQRLFLDNVSLDTNNNLFESSQNETITKDHFFQLYPNLDLFLGLSWEQCMSRRTSIKLYAGWETNFWWDVFNILWIERSISAQGLTAGANLVF